MESLVNDLKSEMQKTLESFERDLANTRSGKASTKLLDRVKVDYYGTPTPIQQVATLSTPDARTIMINPFEKNLLSEIEKEIHKSDLGLQPTNDGQVIRIHIPPLTEERRKEIVKQLKKTTEEAKISVRNQRRSTNDAIKQQEKKKEISEDDAKRLNASVQKVTDEFVTKIDQKFESKEKEILKP